jgi:catechol 2,3-dioxygenase-like lactoylglutathione lyase family enzyme
MKNKVLLSLFTLAIGISSYSQSLSKVDFRPYFSAVVVKDIEASSIWYKSVFGLNVTNRNDSPQRGSKIAVMEGTQFSIELIEVKSSLGPSEILEGKPDRTLIRGFTKIGFKVPDLDATIKYLKELKVHFYGDVYSDRLSGKRSFLVNDPDGNLIQFFE